LSIKHADDHELEHIIFYSTVHAQLVTFFRLLSEIIQHFNTQTLYVFDALIFKKIKTVTSKIFKIPYYDDSS